MLLLEAKALVEGLGYRGKGPYLQLLRQSWGGTGAAPHLTARPRED